MIDILDWAKSFSLYYIGDFNFIKSVIESIILDILHSESVDIAIKNKLTEIYLSIGEDEIFHKLMIKLKYLQKMNLKNVSIGTMELIDIMI